MADRRRFRRLFLRQFFILLTVSVALVAVLLMQHDIPQRSTAEWILFFVLDVAALIAASALSAWLRTTAEDRRRRGPGG